MVTQGPVGTQREKPSLSGWGGLYRIVAYEGRAVLGAQPLYANISGRINRDALYAIGDHPSVAMTFTFEKVIKI